MIQYGARNLFRRNAKGQQIRNFSPKVGRLGNGHYLVIGATALVAASSSGGDRWFGSPGGINSALLLNCCSFGVAGRLSRDLSRRLEQALEHFSGDGARRLRCHQPLQQRARFRRLGFRLQRREREALRVAGGEIFA